VSSLWAAAGVYNAAVPVTHDMLTSLRDAPGDTLRRAAAYVPAVAVLVLVAALSFTAGGYIVTSATPWVVAWLVVVTAWVVLARPSGRRPAALLVSLAALAALAAWTGLSVLWSVGPDLSWVAFDYAALYVAVAVALGWGGTSRAQLRVATVGLLLCVTAVAVYAYLGKVVPDVVTHANEYARLAAPIGYWNVLAVMLVMGLPIGLALAARRDLHPLWRAAAGAVTALLMLTLFFTFSRGGFLAAGVALVLYFAAARERISSLVSLLVTAAPVGFVLWHLRDLTTLFGPTDDAVLRAAEGSTLARWTLVAIWAPFVVQLGVAYLHRRLDVRPLVVRWVGVAVLVLVLATVVGAPLAYLQRRGGVVEWTRTQYRNFIEGPETEGGDTAGRVLVVSSNGRVDLYRIGLEQYRETPAIGTGAGTFSFSNYRYRETGLFVRHAHSQWFNTLSELGIVGLILLAAFVVALAAALVTALVRRRRDVERGLLAASLAAAGAYVFHMSGDWDWDVAAGTVAFLLLAVTAACYRGTSRRRRRRSTGPADDDRALPAEAPAASPAGPEATSRRLGWPLVALWSGLLVLLVVSWLLPSLSLSAERRALAALGRDQAAVAFREAERATTLDPLAAGPLITLASAQERLGRPLEALSTLEAATRLQPENYLAHYRLGLLLANALGREKQAAAEFRRALELNPRHAPSRRQLELLGGA